MKRWPIALLIAFLVISWVFVVKTNLVSYSDDDSDDFEEDGLPSQDSGGIVSNNSNQTPSPPGTISLQQLSQHNSRSDCWIAYRGKVYDISSFLPNHPGSAGAIAPYCGTGTEFTNAFTRQHGTKMVTTLINVGAFIGDFQIVGNI